MSVIGVSELWKIFEWLHGTVKGNRDEYRKRAEAWLDAVYADIKDLSDIWLKLSTGRHLSSKQTKHASEILAETSALRIAQSVTYTKLGQFYLSASQVLPYNNNPFRDEFLDGLGSLLVNRNEARGILDRIFGRRDVGEDDVERLKAAALELQKQAAILQAQITTFKATRW
jgi:hypothetical protein